MMGLKSQLAQTKDLLGTLSDFARVTQGSAGLQQGQDLRWVPISLGRVSRSALGSQEQTVTDLGDTLTSDRRVTRGHGNDCVVLQLPGVSFRVPGGSLEVGCVDAY